MLIGHDTHFKHVYQMASYNATIFCWDVKQSAKYFLSRVHISCYIELYVINVPVQFNYPNTKRPDVWENITYGYCSER